MMMMRKKRVKMKTLQTKSKKVLRMKRNQKSHSLKRLRGWSTVVNTIAEHARKSVMSASSSSLADFAMMMSSIWMSQMSRKHISLTDSRLRKSNVSNVAKSKRYAFYHFYLSQYFKMTLNFRSNPSVNPVESNSLNISAQFASSLTMSTSKRRFTTAKSVEYAELVAKRTRSIATHVDAVCLLLWKTIMNARLQDWMMIVQCAWRVCLIQETHRSFWGVAIQCTPNVLGTIKGHKLHAQFVANQL